MKKIIRIIQVVSIICILTGTVIVSSVYLDTRNSNAIKEKTTDIAHNSLDAEIVALLREAFKNEDVVGYLYFPEAGISYPIVQGKDNEEYLKKDVYGKYSNSGSIFLDCMNSSEFTDAKSIIYGHHMRNGTMFGSLEDNVYGKENLRFTIYTRKEKIVYDVYKTNVIQPDERLNYFKDSKPKDGEACEVTLLTCHYISKGTVRFGVIGKESSREIYQEVK